MSNLEDFKNSKQVKDPTVLNLPVYASDDAANSGFGSNRREGSMFYHSVNDHFKYYKNGNWSVLP